MTSLVMGMIILAAGFALYTMSRSNQSAIANSTALDERGWLAFNAVASQLRQAGYAPPGGLENIPTSMLHGLDACGDPTNVSGVLKCSGARTESDAVLIRFFGSSPPGTTTADNTVIDCAGDGVPAPHGELPRGASLLFVRSGTNGTPALVCRNGIDASSGDIELIRGVERMELLYGVSTANDNMPDKVVSARDMTAEDWRMVATVTVSLLVRGEHPRRGATPASTLWMFGDSHDDPAYRVDTTTQPEVARRLFTGTVQLRNRLSCSAAGGESCR